MRQAGGPPQGAFRPAGLVPLEQVTRETKPQWLLIETAEARLQRMRRSVLTAARLLAASSNSGGSWVMVTLTYRPETEWSPKHFTGFAKCLRAWAARRSIPCRYVWVMELTKAGKPHYHALVWVPKGITLPKADKQGWWPHGWSRTERARSAVGYLAKYSSKGSCGEFPPGARIHGNGGLDGVRPVLRWWLLPRYVRDCCSHLDDVRRIAGGFLSRATGEFWPSRWKFSGAGGGFVRLVQVLPCAA